jgi:hypothetical protein
VGVSHCKSTILVRDSHVYEAGNTLKFCAIFFYVYTTLQYQYEEPFKTGRVLTPPCAIWGKTFINTHIYEVGVILKWFIGFSCLHQQPMQERKIFNPCSHNFRRNPVRWLHKDFYRKCWYHVWVPIFHGTIGHRNMKGPKNISISYVNSKKLHVGYSCLGRWYHFMPFLIYTTTKYPYQDPVQERRSFNPSPRNTRQNLVPWDPHHPPLYIRRTGWFDVTLLCLCVIMGHMNLCRTPKYMKY